MLKARFIKLVIHFFVLFLLNPILLSNQKLEFVDVATGSLGQGLGAACGMAYTGKNFDKSRFVSVKNSKFYWHNKLMLLYP